MTNPADFAENFLKQPFPTMGTAPSSALAITGSAIVQQGTGASAIGQTNQSMWARIASAVPFGWTLFAGAQAAPAATAAATAVKTKVKEGAQAVEGKVKSITQPVTNFLSSVGSYTKWIVVGLVAVAFIVFAAQVKTLVKS